jgi:hypothetical protein
MAVLLKRLEVGHEDMVRASLTYDDNYVTFVLGRSVKLPVAFPEFVRAGCVAKSQCE